MKMRLEDQNENYSSTRTLYVETSDYEWAKTLVEWRGQCGKALFMLTGKHVMGDCHSCPIKLNVAGVEKQCSYNNALQAAKEIMEEEVKRIIEAAAEEASP